MRARQQRHAVGFEFRLQGHALVVHHNPVRARSVRRAQGNRQEEITSMTFLVARLQHASDLHARVACRDCRCHNRRLRLAARGHGNLQFFSWQPYANAGPSPLIPGPFRTVVDTGLHEVGHWQSLTFAMLRAWTWRQHYRIFRSMHLLHITRTRHHRMCTRHRILKEKVTAGGRA